MTTLYPDPPFDGQKAWLLFLANLFIHGGLTHEEAEAFGLDIFNINFMEQHTDSIYCLACYKKLGECSSEAFNIPIVCNTCLKSGANYYKLEGNLNQYRQYSKQSHHVRSYNYLLEHNLKLRKGTWHKLNP